MKVLAVSCHPLADSYCAALTRACLEVLRAGGHEVVDRNLYRDGFDPVLSAEGRARYEDTGANQAGVEAYCAELASAQGLLLIYPTWWYGMPAVIKGWLDRVWLPGVAFGLDDQRRITTHALEHIERFMVITTYGSPWWWIRFGLGDPGRRAVLDGLRPLFSPRCRRAWLALYGMDRNTAADRERFLARVRARLRLFDQ
ncbi:MAG TPA: NAD(P)H-dependent oxidoreductase [Caulobacteraceae bacterium]|jgi:putative NADPH-quinone reductase